MKRKSRERHALLLAILVAVCVCLTALPLQSAGEDTPGDDPSGRAGRGPQTVWGVRMGDGIRWKFSSIAYVPSKVTETVEVTWTVRSLQEASATVLETYIQDGKTQYTNKEVLVQIDSNKGLLPVKQIHHHNAGIVPLVYNGYRSDFWVVKMYNSPDWEWTWDNDDDYFKVHGSLGTGYSGFEPVEKGWVDALIHKGTGIFVSGSFHYQNSDTGIDTTSSLSSETSFQLSSRPYCMPVVAGYRVNVTQGFAPLSVKFTSTVTNGTQPYNYNWDFGDGTTSAIAGPVHVYTKTGTFTSLLTVTDANGVTSVAYLNITVFEMLVVTLGSDVTGGDPPLKVNFTGTGRGGTPPYRYSWKFGDGGTSTQPNPSHTYLSTRKYTVTLTLTDSKNYYVIASKAILVGDVSTHPSTPSNKPGPEPGTVSFPEDIPSIALMGTAAVAAAASAGAISFFILRRRRKAAAGLDYAACPDCGGAVWYQPQFHGFYCNNCARTHTFGPVKRGEVSYYGCPSCNSPVAWLPDVKKWSCGHCGSHPSSGPVIGLSRRPPLS